jgi:hypothetical protein
MMRRMDMLANAIPLPNPNSLHSPLPLPGSTNSQQIMGGANGFECANAAVTLIGAREGE